MHMLCLNSRPRRIDQLITFNYEARDQSPSVCMLFKSQELIGSASRFAGWLLTTKGSAALNLVQLDTGHIQY